MITINSGQEIDCNRNPARFWKMVDPDGIGLRFQNTTWESSNFGFGSAVLVGLPSGKK